MEQADKLENGEISKKEYDEWRYKYPELNIYQRHAKVPSQKLSDYLVQALFDKKKKQKKTLPIFSFLLLKVSKVSLYRLKKNFYLLNNHKMLPFCRQALSKFVCTTHKYWRLVIVWIIQLQ